jgi:hypothetical protein
MPSLAREQHAHDAEATLRQNRVAPWHSWISGGMPPLVQLCKFSLWETYDTLQCHAQLEQQSDDEQQETVRHAWKRTIERGLTLHSTLRHPQ